MAVLDKHPSVIYVVGVMVFVFKNLFVLNKHPPNPIDYLYSNLSTWILRWVRPNV